MLECVVEGLIRKRVGSYEDLLKDADRVIMPGVSPHMYLFPLIIFLSIKNGNLTFMTGAIIRPECIANTTI